MKNPDLSIITTLYNSEIFLDDFISQCISALAEIQCNSYEIIFVNDGSPDDSLNTILNLKKKNENIVLIDLSRNFGHHYAISAGLSVSKGDLVFLIDCDMEVSPKVLIDFKNIIDNSDTDVVYGVQKVRKGSFIKRELGGIFWKAFNLFSETKMPKNVITERLMKRPYVDSLKTLGDKNLFLGGMMYWVGYNQKSIEVNKKNRKGKSSYSFSKRLNLFVEAITSFSEQPLKLIFKLGVLITLMAILVIIFMIIRKIFYPESILLGYTSIIISVFFSLGILTSSIGIIGIYLSRIFKQTQNRPNYIIKKIY
ncbi:MAG: glycosyltransferase family 2 protein [Bacteroidales bacterium]|nr:glycosyltransferase family 2 protein [Saprospiraceae bacterium]MCF8381572.1 glycosyltransferase family 2 protein [Bacteroidales bacterium]